MFEYKFTQKYASNQDDYIIESMRSEIMQESMQISVD